MSNRATLIPWDDLLDEIEAGECVLVIGPELVSFPNNQTLFQLLCQQLTSDEKYKDSVMVSPQYIFETEELLQPKSHKNLTALRHFYQEFYWNRTEFDESFAKIAQLPFSLIVSLIPNERLSGIFDSMGRAHQFSYYQGIPNEEMPEAVSEPTRDKPLLYNILGTVGTPTKKRKQCVFTFDHLFTYLQGILGTRPLPVKLAETLLKAQTVLFLGVHFERWYMQMLLRVLLPDNSKVRKYSLLRGDPASEVSLFLTGRLALEFLSVEPTEFLGELYRQCAQRNLLIAPRRPTKSTVFVSYSHADKIIVNQLTEALRRADIAVIVDEESMPVGERISRFMKRVVEVDALVVVVSERSMHSPFVGKEISYCLENGIRLIPVFLDKEFLEPTIGRTIRTRNNEHLRTIQQEISARKQADPLDTAKELMAEEQLRQEFGRMVDGLVATLQDQKQISLLHPVAEAGFLQLIHELLTDR